jgi:hypothetical protein
MLPLLSHHHPHPSPPMQTLPRITLTGITLAGITLMLMLHEVMQILHEARGNRMVLFRGSFLGS